MPFQYTPNAPAIHRALLVDMPGVLAPITRVTPHWIGWLPYLSPREPTRPESLRARLYRLSHSFNSRPPDENKPDGNKSDANKLNTQDDYQRLMNSIHGYARRADF